MGESVPPLKFIWQGDGFTPAGKYWAGQADKHFVIGESYRLVPVEDRNMEFHKAYFATINEAWQNLPDDKAKLHPSAEALRKHALIAVGYCTQKVFTCSSPGEARRMAAFVDGIDEFSIVSRQINVVVLYRAASQTVRAMGKKVFDDSAHKVLAWIAAELGVSLEQLKENTGKSEGGQR